MIKLKLNSVFSVLRFWFVFLLRGGAIASTLLFLTSCGGGGSGGFSSSSPTLPPPPPPPPPPANEAPQFTGSSVFSSAENNRVEFAVTANDPDGSNVSFTLNSDLDGVLFSIDRGLGVIVANAGDGSFDFENPQDLDQDNIYEISVVVTDGSASTTQTFTLTISDVEEPATCPVDEVVPIHENVTGDFYQVQAVDPDGESPSLYGPYLQLSRPNGGDITDDFKYGVNFRPNDGYFWFFDLIDADSLGDLEAPFVYELEVKFPSETITCSVSFKVVDTPNEVKSGIKISGTQRDVKSVGDIDGDGIEDLWLSNRVREQNKPWGHEGYLVFGKAMNEGLSVDSAVEFQTILFTPNQAVRILGTFPGPNENQYIGNDLVPSRIGDIDNDGLPELLLTLQTGEDSRDAAYADRPLAYIIWGNAIASQVDGEIDLNNLLPSEGMKFEG